MDDVFSCWKCVCDWFSMWDWASGCHYFLILHHWFFFLRVHQYCNVLAYFHPWKVTFSFVICLCTQDDGWKWMSWFPILYWLPVLSYVGGGLLLYITKIAILWLPICTSFDFLFLSPYSCFELLWCAFICNLPPAHVFIFRVFTVTTMASASLFFLEQLEELATWHVGTLPHTVVTLSCVNGSVSVSVYWRLTSGFNKGPPTTKSILDECIWRVLAL